MYKRDIYLDIDDELNNYIKSVELDSDSRVWHFHLTVDYEPLDLTGKSVQFRAEKPDKTNVLNDCKIVDAEKGVVEVKLTRQVNAIPGHVKCLLKIIGDEGFVLKTKTFVVDVSKTLSDDAIVSSDEFGALEVALGKVQDIDNRFAQTNAQLLQINKNTINADVFGVVGDGITDTTAALQDAIDYCRDNKKELWLNDGEYIISHLTINDVVVSSNFYKNCVLKALSQSDDALVTIYGDVTINNMTFDGDKKVSKIIVCGEESEEINLNSIRITKASCKKNGSYPTTDAITVAGTKVKCNDLIVDNNDGHGCNIAAYVVNADYEINNSKFISNGTGLQGLGLTCRNREFGKNIRRLSVNGCMASHNGASGIATHSCNNVIINNCHSQYNGEHGFVLMDGKNATITGNVACYNASGGGLRIQGDYAVQIEDDIVGWDNAVVSGNNFDSNKYGVVMGYNVRNVEICSNRITNCAESTIHFNYTDGHTDCYNINSCSNVLHSKQNFYLSSAPRSEYILDSTIKIDDFDIFGGKITDYTLHGSKSPISVAKNKCGDRSNVIKSPTNIVDSSWHIYGSQSDGVVTSATNGYYYHQRLDYNQERHIYIITNFDYSETTEENVRIGVRLRKSDGSLLEEKIYRYPKLNQEISVLFDLLDGTNINNLKQSVYCDVIVTGTSGHKVKPIYTYVSYSNEPTIIPNKI